MAASKSRRPRAPAAVVEKPRADRRERASRSGKDAGERTKVTSSPCLLDEDDPEIDPHYIGLQ